MTLGSGTPDVQKMEEMKEVEKLIKALGYEKVSDVRRAMAAVEALRKIGEPAVEPLIRALNDSNYYVRFRAALSEGDFRNWDDIEAWAVSIAHALEALQTPPRNAPSTMIGAERP